MVRKIGLWIFTALFAFSIAFFAIFGEGIREGMSPLVKVTYPSFIQTDKGSSYNALPESCFYDEFDGAVYVYVLEEREIDGETAYYAKKIKVERGYSNGEYTVMKQTEESGRFIYECSTSLEDGMRVKLDKE
ncbi:MAG: hypothetical protein E7623_01315 [Ruminococcaceae bacterium]|nr:hypothetical protein [Oscillospiraceae bacterium]